MTETPNGYSSAAVSGEEAYREERSSERGKMAKNQQGSDGRPQGPPNDEPLLRDATQRFETARAACDYAGAMAAALSTDHVDRALNDALSRDILDGKKPAVNDVIRHVDNLVFWGNPVPHVLALYLSDIAQGKSRGGRPRKKLSRIVGDNYDLSALIEELIGPTLSPGESKTAAIKRACERCAELCRQARAGSVPSDLVMKEFLVRLAHTSTGRNDPASLERAYYRATRGRTGPGLKS